MRTATIKGLYAIVDASFPDPIGIAKKLLAGGARLLQLRAKGMHAVDHLELARKIGAECRRYDAIFIVNDRADIAMLADADGLHLGQDDMPIDEARKMIGTGKLIGISTHGPKEAREAVMAGADYIGYGPVFKTGTKKDADAVKGLEGLRAVRSEVSLPVVAIGGINDGNILSIFDAGANAAAVISALAGASDIKQATCNMLNLLGGANEC